jgi:AraC family transcriptional regulator
LAVSSPNGANDVYRPADVRIVEFPATKVAAIEHIGSPSLEHDTARTLIAWKISRRLLDPVRYRSYGVHYTDPRTTPASEHRVSGERVGAIPLVLPLCQRRAEYS